MCGFKCLVFASLVTLPCILKAAEQKFRSKGEEPCGGDIDLELMGGVAEIRLRTGVINGVEFYRIFEDCTWTLKTADDHFMILKSDYFSVEKSENCISDYVKITEKGFDGATSRHCGSDPLTYITFGNIIQLQFKSDDSSEYKGFKFTIKSVKKLLDDTFCIGSILGGEDSSIVNKETSGDNCFYRIQAPKHNGITLTLKMLDFGSASCEEESIIIYEGNSTQGRPLGTICSDNDLGILPYRASSMFIEYSNPLKLDGGRFEIEYMFVEDNLMSSTSPSLIWGNDAPCGEEIDLELTDGVAEIQSRTKLFNGIEFYRVNEDCTWTLKIAQDNFMILKSDYFIVEESENCIWDYVEITEKGVDGTTSKYCGRDPLTYITFASEIQLRFKSDVSYGYKGFKFIIEASKRVGDDSKCIGSILGGEDSRIMNKDDLEEDCFYRIQAPGDKVITLELKMLDFGSASCEEESIIIYEGHSTHGKPLGTICSDGVPGNLPFHASSMFIEYRNPLQQEGERFTIDYMFVVDNFTPAPVPSTTPSPVGGNNDCSRMYKGIDTDSGILVYTAPKYENNKDCIVVVRNDQLPYHVVQAEFDYFDIEESDNCIFDSLRVLSGERNGSALLGGPYCGESLHGRIILTRGNSLRLEFKTDVSFALKGFQANISFVPNTECRCNGKKMCIRQDFEKKCIRGQKCEANICQNGGTCIKTASVATCYCPKGFQGEDCSQSDGEKSYHIRFTTAPVDRTIKRGEGHVEECNAEVPYGEEVEYNWSLKGTLIGPYSKKAGFGTHPGGVLQIDDFSDELEGQYSCFATTSGGTAEHTFEYRIAEDCKVRIFPGPQSESKKVNEMALLICRVDHRAKAVRWKKDGVYIDYDKDDRIKKMANNYLRILNVGMQDAGVYQCEAEDENGCYSYKEGKLRVVDVKSFSSYCGITIHEEAMLSSRISKGSEAPPKMYPWHVTFRSTGDASRKKVFCGGTLISQSFVVTAAHCIKEFSKVFGVDFGAKNVELLLGTTDCLGTQNDGIRRTLRSFTVHPNYEDRGGYDNDIALIELDSLVEYTDDIRPICVESEEYNDRVFLENSVSFGRVIGKVAGCGATRSNGRSMPGRLRDVYIPYVDRITCLESMGNERHKLTDTMFCAGSNIARTGDSCEGDNGGGLIMATSTRWVLTGVVSWGRGCDVDKHYGVYTNVGMFYDWIESVTKFNEEEVPDFFNHY